MPDSDKKSWIVLVLRNDIPEPVSGCTLAHMTDAEYSELCDKIDTEAYEEALENLDQWELADLVAWAEEHGYFSQSPAAA
jgi:hypothetical protein